MMLVMEDSLMVVNLRSWPIFSSERCSFEDVIFQDTYLVYEQNVQSKKILTDCESSFNVTQNEVFFRFGLRDLIYTHITEINCQLKFLGSQ